MKILQVVPYYAPAWAYGGPPKVMWEEARALVRLGHDVEAFTTDALDEHARVRGPLTAIEDGVVVHRFPNISNYLAYHQYRFQPRGFFTAMARATGDVIHLSEMRHELAIGAWMAAKKNSIPIAVSAHGTLPLRSGIKAQVRRLYDKRWVRPMLDGAAALLAQTSHEAQLYREFGGHEARIHLLPLGVDDPPTGDVPEVQLGVPPGDPYVLFLGRISPLKGVGRLIQGFAEIANEHPDLHLVIAGRDDGALADTRALANALPMRDRVHFPGPIYGDARYSAYRGARLFAVTPTHFEETSLASLEAASVGVPLLISDEADVPYLDAHEAGIRVPAGENPAGALRAALATDRDVMGAGAARMIADHHRWPVVARRLADLLASAA